jgi:uncharacterized protein YxjI
MYNYPLNLSFKVLAFNPQVTVTDASGQTILYVKQKALAFKEDIKVYSDKTMSVQLFQINANKLIDFSAKYTIKKADGSPIGTIQREGMKSLWKATYNLLNSSDQKVGVIHEQNPWLRILDNLASNIPFLSMFINPSYLIDMGDQNKLVLKKMPAFMEGKFSLTKTGDFTDQEEQLMINSIIMMTLLERMRG